MYFVILLACSVFLYIITARNIRLPSYLVAASLTLYLGLRQSIGGDWDEYLRIYQVIKSAPLTTLPLWRYEPGYWLIVAISPFFTMWNLLMAGISTAALYYAARAMHLKTFRLLLPLGFLLLFILSYTGFVRQGAAASLFAFAATQVLWKKKILLPSLFLLLGLSFHNPIKVLFNIDYLQHYIQIFPFPKNSSLPIAAEATFNDITFLKIDPDSENLNTLEKKAPGETKYHSRGASLRILFLLSLVASLLILKTSARRLDLELKVLLFLSLSLATLLLTNHIVTGISAAVDRSIYYIIPFFFLVLSKKMDNHNPSFKLDWAEVMLITMSSAFSLSWLILSPYSLSYK